MKPVKPLLLLAAGLLAGCASGYGPSRFYDKTGYAEERLESGAYKITYRGDRNTDETRLGDFARLRAAELCVENGCTHFLILSRLHEPGADFETTVAQSETRFGESTRSVSYTDTEPTCRLTVRFFKDAPPPLAQDARRTIHTLKARHGL